MKQVPKLKDWLYLSVPAWRLSIDSEAFLQQVLERRLVVRKVKTPVKLHDTRRIVKPYLSISFDQCLYDLICHSKNLVLTRLVYDILSGFVGGLLIFQLCPSWHKADLNILFGCLAYEATSKRGDKHLQCNCWQGLQLRHLRQVLGSKRGRVFVLLCVASQGNQGRVASLGLVKPMDEESSNEQSPQTILVE
ncbi:unnamed protein product [Citrullus colocynthis]|uniref:Uncharacterized protein n=1 Tax=Citrullus colocynthis TaxID=252529 RepID=A0ABP0Z4L9_9ROSI